MGEASARWSAGTSGQGCGGIFRLVRTLTQCSCKTCQCGMYQATVKELTGRNRIDTQFVRDTLVQLQLCVRESNARTALEPTELREMASIEVQSTRRVFAAERLSNVWPKHRQHSRYKIQIEHLIMCCGM